MASAQAKTVIVTGAAGGLGKAIADAFLAAGANVVICDVNPQRIASVDEEWAKSYAGRFLTQQADVTDEAAVQKLIDAAVTKFGRLDVLVNNAGVMDDFSPVGACSKEKWDRVLNINLNGPFLTTKAAIAQFEKQEAPVRGVIINIGSNASTHGFKSGAAYTVSKAGVMALTKNTAGFYGDKGIYCMALLLGGMNTNINDAFAAGLNMEMFQKIQASQTPFTPEKFVPIESVAKYCLFLTDKDIAPSANGSCIVFNNNWPEA
ncbi:NAD(P)-binding protein [Canariomyces notabilis]|uniref:NAD(P)-binding protein n=1 Tax=Canariomyces notabilis TaxID=2074819 RepID=A0AAN6TNI8_9PEZI|nr:NAD(P)-binding protein [Canariomyces arenarius]